MIEPGQRFDTRFPEIECEGPYSHAYQVCRCFADDRALAALVVRWRRTKRFVLAAFTALMLVAAIAGVLARGAG